MSWDTIEKRWQQFLGMMRGRQQKAGKGDWKAATGVPKEAVIKMQDHRDEPDDFYGHGRVG